MYCQKCGTQNSDDANFCSKCGNNFKSIKPEIERKGITGEWVTAESLKRIAAIKPEKKGITGKLGKMGIPGFRSGKTWKMILATLVYLFIGIPIFSGFIAAFVFGVSSSDTDAPSTSPVQTSKSQPSQNIISSSFSDYGNVYCDESATTLQKETLFNDKFKNKYVKWTGTVSSVAESWGSYKLQVKHCSKTLISDVIVTMKDDQKNKLMQLREGDTVTYIAKLTSYGEILDISADDGVIVQ